MNSIISKLLADKAVAWFKNRGSDKKTGWFTKVVMGLVVFAFVAYLAYKGNSKGKELAKLKHERDLAKEEEKQAKLDWELGELDSDIEEKLRKLQDAQEKLATLEGAIVSLGEAAEFERIKIEAIENWDDMDRYINSIGGEHWTSPGR